MTTVRSQAQESRSQKGVVSEDQYNPYRMLKSQVEYFCRKNRLDRTCQALLEGSRWELSFTFPLKPVTGKTRVVRGYGIRRKNNKGNVLGVTVVEPGLTLDWLRAKSLGLYLQTQLLDLPFGLLLVGIDSQGNRIPRRMSRGLRDVLEEKVFSPFCNQADSLSWTTNHGQSNYRESSRLYRKCVGSVIEQATVELLPSSEEVTVTTDSGGSLGTEVLELLPRETFKVIPADSATEASINVLLLTGQNKLSGADAVDLRADVVVELTNAVITPEAGMVLAEKEVAIVPDLVTTAPETIALYFDWLTGCEYFQGDDEEIQEEGEKMMKDLIREICAYSRENSTSLRTGAYSLAILRSALALGLDRQKTGEHTFRGDGYE